MPSARSALPRRFLPIGTVACVLLLGCPDNPERARLDAIRSFEGVVPGMIAQMRDALFPVSKGQTLAEKAVFPPRYLKNLDYRIEPTFLSEYPFLASLAVEMEGVDVGPTERKKGRARLELRILVSLEFVRTREDWRLYSSRVLSPTGLPVSLDEGQGGDPLRLLKELFASWKKSVRISE